MATVNVTYLNRYCNIPRYVPWFVKEKSKIE